jgi:hypothetical protein
VQCLQRGAWPCCSNIGAATFRLALQRRHPAPRTHEAAVVDPGSPRSTASATQRQTWQA